LESSYQKSARDTILIGVSTLIAFVVGMIQLPLLTKTLGAYSYGVWTQVNVTISLILPFAGLGLTDAMIRFLAAEKDKRGIQEGFYSVVLVLFLVSLVFSLAVIIFAYPMATSFFDGAVQIVRLTGILILLFPLSFAYLSLIRTFQQVRRYAIFQIVENVGRLGLIAYLVLSGHGILSIVLSLVALKASILLVLFFLIKSQIGIKMPNFSRIKEYLSYGLPIVPRSIGFWVIYLSDRYVISFFLGLTSVGIYSAAYGIGNFGYSIMSVMTFVLWVALPQLYDEGRMDEVRTHLSYSLKYLMAILIPFVFGAAVLAEPILRMFSTPEIASQGYFITPLSALAFLLLSVHGVVSHILLLTKKTKIMALIWIFAAALNLGLNILVVPRIGIIGAVITTLFAFSLALGGVAYYAFKELRFRIDWLFIIKSMIASAIMSLAVWLMAPQGNLDTILAVVAGVVIYGVLLLLLKGFTREEISFFRGLLRRRAS